MQYINNNSDFALDIALKAILPDGAELATAPPNCDFTLTFGTRYDEAKYEVGRYNGEPHGYTVNADGSLHVIFDAHGLGLGRLGCMLAYGIQDSSYPDGVATVATSYELDVELIGWGADGQQSGTVTLATEAAAVGAAQQAQAAAEKAAADVVTAVQTAQAAEQTAKAALSTAGEAVVTANESAKHADLSAQASEASRQEAAASANEAREAVQRASEAVAAAGEAINIANEATVEARTAANAANTAADNANTAADKINQCALKTEVAELDDRLTAGLASERAERESIDNKLIAALNSEATERAAGDAAVADMVRQLIPSALAVEAPQRITLGNLVAQYVVARLVPSDTLPNVLFLSDGKAVAVDQSGRLTVVGEGESVVQVVPTMHTSIAKSVRISVERPTLRLYDTRTKLRLTQSGGLLLN